MTLGTHHQPFPRLIAALSDLPADELVVQHGESAPPAAAREVHAYLPRARMLELMCAADVVITHAGVGSILSARRCGHVPLVVPRRPELGEHVDGHQLDLTEVLSEYGRVVAVHDMADLPAQVDAVRRAGRIDPDEAPRATPLHRAVRAAMLGEATASAS